MGQVLKGYMEVVCLILGPMLVSQPCSYAFWVLTSLHLLENVFYYSCIYTFVTNKTCMYKYMQHFISEMSKQLISETHTLLLGEYAACSP